MKINTKFSHFKWFKVLTRLGAYSNDQSKSLPNKKINKIFHLKCYKTLLCTYIDDEPKSPSNMKINCEFFLKASISY